MFTIIRIRRSIALMCSIGIAAWAAACNDAPTMPTADNGPRLKVSSTGERYLSMDTPSDQIAALVPAFGGAFVEDGKLNVYLTKDVAGDKKVEAAVRDAVGQVLASNGRAELPVVILPGDYSFVQLRTWETALRPNYSRLGVHTAGIDERANRLSVISSSASTTSEIETQLSNSNIPADAVVRRVGPRGEAFTLLTDKVRPVRGGLAITTVFN